LKDLRPKEVWIELKEVLDSCGNCKHNPSCIVVRNHVTQCTEQTYRFRCPIEILDER